MESVIGDLVTSSIEQGGPMGTPIGLTSPRELDREHYARILTSGGVPHRYELLDYQYIRGGFIHLLERPSWAIALQREEQRKAAAGGKEKDGPPGFRGCQDSEDSENGRFLWILSLRLFRRLQNEFWDLAPQQPRAFEDFGD